MMKKILIIEDEYKEIKIAFEYVKNVLYSGELELKNVKRSQDIKFTNLCNYDVIFIDITLERSEMDGFDILKNIEQKNINYKKIVIMTGNNKISALLEKRGIKNKYPILSKPIDFNEISKMLD